MNRVISIEKNQSDFEVTLFLIQSSNYEYIKNNLEFKSIILDEKSEQVDSRLNQENYNKLMIEINQFISFVESGIEESERVLINSPK